MASTLNKLGRRLLSVGARKYRRLWFKYRLGGDEFHKSLDYNPGLAMKMNAEQEYAHHNELAAKRMIAHGEELLGSG